MKKMKKLFSLLILLVAFVLVTTITIAAKPTTSGKGIGTEKSKNNCTKIQDGVLTYSAGHYLGGQPLQIGYDAYGYNYQGHMFKGSYINAYLGGAGFPPYEGSDESYLAENPSVVNHWAWPYRTIQLIMKWNDAWMANTDCDNDGKLDRHYGYESYIGSGAWETNHMFDEYVQDNTVCKWNDFVKIVAVPADAYISGGIWYTADGLEIGPAIWGEFAIIQEVYNDPCEGYHGLLYSGETPDGFGYYMPKP